MRTLNFERTRPCQALDLSNVKVIREQQLALVQTPGLHYCSITCCQSIQLSITCCHTRIDLPMEFRNNLREVPIIVGM